MENELILLDVASHRVHHLNPTASVIWQRCDGRHSVAEIATELADAYGVSREKVLKDVLHTLGELARMKLIEDRTAGEG